MTTIEDYIAQLPASRRERGEAVHALVRRLFPAATASLRYRMPTYDLDGNFLAWSNKKACLSLYTCSAERIRSFRNRHPAHRCGVGCIHFRDQDPFPLSDIETVVRNALAPGRAIQAREGKKST